MNPRMRITTHLLHETALLMPWLGVELELGLGLVDRLPKRSRNAARASALAGAEGLSQSTNDPTGRQQILPPKGRMPRIGQFGARDDFETFPAARRKPDMTAVIGRSNCSVCGKANKPGSTAVLHFGAGGRAYKTCAAASETRQDRQKYTATTSALGKPAIEGASTRSRQQQNNR
jgi:hypothetical protein